MVSAPSWHSSPVPADPTPAELEVDDWIRQRGIPLYTTEPRAPLGDLESLRALVGDAIVVGIGPSTYGGHEQFTLSHRVIRFLVEELGFRTVATEEDWDVALGIDRYVRTGEGDIDALMKATRMPWRVREVQQAIEWIREYNRKHADQVRFVGVGPIDTGAPVSEEVTRYRQALRVAESPSPADEDREHARRIVAFYESYAYHLADDGYRDAKMGDNLHWWHQHTGHKIAFWTTTANSARSQRLRISVPPRGTMTFRPTGGRLRELFSDKYFSIGLTFGYGMVNSGWSVPPFQSRPVPAPAPQDGFVERLFHNHGSPRYLLSLRGEVPDVVREWLDGPAKTRLIGAACDAGDPTEEYYMTGGSLAEWFDVILHQREVTPTQVLW
jgi:erythromycin esterase